MSELHSTSTEKIGNIKIGGTQKVLAIAYNALACPARYSLAVQRIIAAIEQKCIRWGAFKVRRNLFGVIPALRKWIRGSTVWNTMHLSVVPALSNAKSSKNDDCWRKERLNLSNNKAPVVRIGTRAALSVFHDGR